MEHRFDERKAAHHPGSEFAGLDWWAGWGRRLDRPMSDGVERQLEAGWAPPGRGQRIVRWIVAAVLVGFVVLACVAPGAQRAVREPAVYTD